MINNPPLWLLASLFLVLCLLAGFAIRSAIRAGKDARITAAQYSLRGGRPFMPLE